MRRLAVLCMLVLGLCWSDGVHAATKYVRPAADCAQNGDGTSFTCASSSGRKGAWRSYPVPSAMKAGDVLKICGRFAGSNELTIDWLFNTRFNGLPDNLVTITGDCTAEGGFAMAIIGNLTVRGVQP